MESPSEESLESPILPVTAQPVKKPAKPRTVRARKTVFNRKEPAGLTGGKPRNNERLATLLLANEVVRFVEEQVAFLNGIYGEGQFTVPEIFDQMMRNFDHKEAFRLWFEPFREETERLENEQKRAAELAKIMKTQ